MTLMEPIISDTLPCPHILVEPGPITSLLRFVWVPRKVLLTSSLFTIRISIGRTCRLCHKHLDICVLIIYGIQISEFLNYEIADS